MTFTDKFKYFPFYILSLIPLGLLYICSNGIYFIVYYVIAYRRSVVRSNLEIAFPELTHSERKEIEKNFYYHFCDSFVESLKAISIGKQNLLRRIKIINPEIMDEFKSKDKSFILYSGHLGNWEWMLSFPLVLKPKIITFYLPLKNNYFSELIKSIRGRFGVVSVEAGRGYKALVKYKTENVTTFTLFLADQSPHKDANMYWTKFFNRYTSFNTGINAISKKLKPVILFPHFRKVARGFYEVEFIKIWDGESKLNDYEVIDIFAARLEEAIKETPHIWLWTHRRWKLNKKDYEPKKQ
jgi:Kdo2-lipid IVA lauroyltransferase/acyltransferase